MSGGGGGACFFSSRNAACNYGGADLCWKRRSAHAIWGGDARQLWGPLRRTFVGSVAPPAERCLRALTGRHGHTDRRQPSRRLLGHLGHPPEARAHLCHIREARAILGRPERTCGQPKGGNRSEGGLEGERRAQEAAKAGEALPGAFGRERGLQEGAAGPVGQLLCGAQGARV
jgi:hypothetical protein